MKNLFLILALILSTTSYATHIVSGNISYEYIRQLPNGDHQYLIEVHLLRDCNNGQVNFDEEIEIGTYLQDADRSLHSRLTLSLLARESQKPDDCITASARTTIDNDFCYEVGYYSRIVVLDPSTSGYILTFDRCCRNEIQNILAGNSGPNQGIHLRTVIHSMQTNASPMFDAKISPVKIIAVNDTASLIFEKKDAEGDSIVYTLANAWAGTSTQANVEPRPSDQLNDVVINYRPGYNGNAPLGTANGAFIRKEPNRYSLMATEEGSYLLAFNQKEYRDAVLISETTVERYLIAFNLPDDAYNNTNVPRNLELTSYDVEESVKLKWKNCINAIEEYEVYRSANGSSYAQIGTTTSMTYTDTEIQGQNNYEYFVKGIPTAGFSSGNSDTAGIYAYGLGTEQTEIITASIYPNPATGTITLKSSQHINAVKIRRLNGTLVSEISINDSQANLNVQSLSSGVYLLQVLGKNTVSHHKVVIR